MSVRIFSNEDQDAPVLTDDPGSLINILKKCLIDGYGSTAAHGAWEMIQNTNGTKAAFRSTDTDANGIWLYADDTPNNRAWMGMAEVFTGFDENDEPNADTEFLTTGRQWSKTITPGLSPWKIICDQRFIYWFHMYSVDQDAFDTYGWTGAWLGRTSRIENEQYEYIWHSSGNLFGDLVDPLPNDSYATILSHKTSTRTGSTNSNEHGAAGAVAEDFFILAKGTDQLSSGDLAWIKAPNTDRNSRQISYRDGPTYPVALTPNGLIISDIPNVFTNNKENGNAIYRGRTPGVYFIPMEIGNDRDSATRFYQDFQKWNFYNAIFDGTRLAGRNMTITGFATGVTSSDQCSIGFVDTTGPWR